MKTTLRFLLTVALFAAMAFTLSACSSDDGNGDNGGTGGTPSSGTPSSSSMIQSSSSSVEVSSSSSLLISSSSDGTSSSSENADISSSSNDDDENRIEDYRTVTIGNQTWTASNLGYEVEGGGVCYSGSGFYLGCEGGSGRLYNWAAAMALDSNCNSTVCADQIDTPHRGICPKGSHIPTIAEWDELYRYADGTIDSELPYESPYKSTTAGRSLRLRTGWAVSPCSNAGGSTQGSDEYDFGAIPTGYGSDGTFSGGQCLAYWWSTAEVEISNGEGARATYMQGRNDSTMWGGYYKTQLFAVRCIKD